MAVSETDPTARFDPSWPVSKETFPQEEFSIVRQRLLGGFESDERRTGPEYGIFLDRCRELFASAPGLASVMLAVDALGKVVGCGRRCRCEDWRAEENARRALRPLDWERVLRGFCEPGGDALAGYFLAARLTRLASAVWFLNAELFAGVSVEETARRLVISRRRLASTMHSVRAKLRFEICEGAPELKR